jgi:cellulose synthase/poly-beta-1,6-N-acetylglucosamine synthase-like glycosyltransferase
MATPPVSVLVAAYDEAAVIAKLLDSLRRNHYPDLEVLVVDDGSTDGTADATRSVGWDRVRLIRQPNSGKAAALKRALAHARSEIVLTFDADSVLRPGTVAALARHFTDPRVGAVAGQVKVGNRHGLLTRWQSLTRCSKWVDSTTARSPRTATSRCRCGAPAGGSSRSPARSRTPRCRSRRDP